MTIIGSSLLSPSSTIERRACRTGRFRSRSFLPTSHTDQRRTLLIEQHFDTCIAQRFNYLFNFTVVFMIASTAYRPYLACMLRMIDQLLLLEWLRFFIDNVPARMTGPGLTTRSTRRFRCFSRRSIRDEDRGDSTLTGQP